jgi:hypothetical protein
MLDVPLKLVTCRAVSASVTKVEGNQQTFYLIHFV